jgi:hypothetical protein
MEEEETRPPRGSGGAGLLRACVCVKLGEYETDGPLPAVLLGENFVCENEMERDEDPRSWAGPLSLRVFFYQVMNSPDNNEIAILKKEIIMKLF